MSISAKSASYSMVFFSHNKSVNSTFSHGFLAKRAGAVRGTLLINCSRCEVKTEFVCLQWHESLQEFAGLPTGESCRRSPFYSRRTVCRQDFPIPVGKPLSKKILSANRTLPTGIRVQSASFRRQPRGLSAKEQRRQLGCRSLRRQPGLSANPHFTDNQGCWQSMVCRQPGLLAKPCLPTARAVGKVRVCR